MGHSLSEMEIYVSLGKHRTKLWEFPRRGDVKKPQCSHENFTGCLKMEDQSPENGEIQSAIVLLGIKNKDIHGISGW